MVRILLSFWDGLSFSCHVSFRKCSKDHLITTPVLPQKKLKKTLTSPLGSPSSRALTGPAFATRGNHKCSSWHSGAALPCDHLTARYCQPLPGEFSMHETRGVKYWTRVIIWHQPKQCTMIREIPQIDHRFLWGVALIRVGFPCDWSQHDSQAKID